MVDSAEYQNISQIGYITKASESLPFPIQLLGETSDAAGKRTYYYTAYVAFDSWEANKKKIEELNTNSELTSVFGKAGFPSLPHRGKSDFSMLYENKKLFDIKDSDTIYGDASYGWFAYRMFCSTGTIGESSKDQYAKLFAVWKTNQLVV